MHSDFVQLLGHYSSSSTEHVASADCETSSRSAGSGKALCNHYNLPYYPYIIYGTNGNKQGEYSGSRSYSSMKSFIDSHFAATADTEEPVCNAATVEV